MSALPVSQDPSGKQTSLTESQLLQDVLQQLTPANSGWEDQEHVVYKRVS